MRVLRGAALVSCVLVRAAQVPLQIPVSSTTASPALIDSGPWSFDKKPDANSTKHLVFDTVSAALQHWPNTRYRNGHNLIPGIVPIGTLLYHGTFVSQVPTEPQWIATDPEHSHFFCRGTAETGCWHLTLVAARPLRMLYFDGSSAAKLELGSMDSQDLVAWGKVIPEYVFQEKKRIADLCEWGKQYGVDGFVRMEMDFEIMLCDFTAGVEVVSFLNLASDNRLPPPPPRNVSEDNVSKSSSDELDAQDPLEDRPPPPHTYSHGESFPPSVRFPPPPPSHESLGVHPYLEPHAPPKDLAGRHPHARPPLNEDDSDPSYHSHGGPYDEEGNLGGHRDDCVKNPSTHCHCHDDVAREPPRNKHEQHPPSHHSSHEDGPRGPPRDEWGHPPSRRPSYDDGPRGGRGKWKQPPPPPLPHENGPQRPHRDERDQHSPSHRPSHGDGLRGPPKDGPRHPLPPHHPPLPSPDKSGSELHHPPHLPPPRKNGPEPHHPPHDGPREPLMDRPDHYPHDGLREPPKEGSKHRPSPPPYHAPHDGPPREEPKHRPFPDHAPHDKQWGPPSDARWGGSPKDGLKHHLLPHHLPPPPPPPHHHLPPLPPRPGPLPSGYSGLQQQEEQQHMATAPVPGGNQTTSVIESGHWHNRYPGERRIQLDLTRVISFYDASLFPSLVEARFGQERWDHRLQGLSEEDVQVMFKRLGEVLSKDAWAAKGSGVDWQTLFRTVIERYGDRLEVLQYLLKNATTGTEAVSYAQKHLKGMLEPYILHSAVPTNASAVTGSKDYSWASGVFEHCATTHTSFIAKLTTLTQSEELLLSSVQSVSKEICRIVVGLWAEGVEFGLNNDEGLMMDKADELAESWATRTEELMRWLDWSVWIKCRPACGYDEMCYLPTWPFFRGGPRRGPGGPGGPGGPDGPGGPLHLANGALPQQVHVGAYDDPEYEWLRPQPRCIPRIPSFS